MKLYIFAFFLILFNSLHAQSTHTKNISVDNGLPSNNVNTAIIDKKGNLYIGSRAGLFVKNGNTFENVNQATQYKFNNIVGILEDANEGKWIAGYGQGLLYFNNKKSKLLNKKSGLIDNNARSLFLKKDQIYVGTQNGISIISIKDFSIKNPKFLQNKKFLFSVTSFFSIRDKIYATTANDGIFEVTEHEVKKVSSLKKAFSSVIFQNKLYVSTDKKLLELNTKTFEIVREFEVGNIWKFLPINDKLYFVSSGIYEAEGGLFELSKNIITDLTKTFDIQHTDLNTIAYDKENNYIYLGTQDNGLVQINLNVPISFSKPNEEIYTLNLHNNNKYLFHSKGFSWIENNVIKKNIELSDFKKFQLKNPSKFKKIAVIENHFYPIDYNTSAEKIIFYNSEIENNKLWVSSNIGLFTLSLEGKILSYYPIHVFDFNFYKGLLIMPVPYAGVRVFEDISKFKYKYFHDWQKPNVPTEIVEVAKTENAVFFASALNGLFAYKNGKFHSFLNDKKFAESKLKRICTTKNGDLIVITDFNDLYYLDVSSETIKIKKYISHDKIKGSTTFFVNEIDGVIFVGTNLGINVFYKDRYYLIDKAQGFTNYNSTKAIASSKQLIIGTKNGHYTLENNYFKIDRNSKTFVALQKITVNNQERAITSNSQLEFPFNKNNISLFFSNPNVKYPDKINYQFRLKKTEPWRKLNSTNQLTLNYLESDSYQIELKITNEDTGIITTQTLAKITINPPFYQRLWFILISILFVIIGCYLIYNSRIKFLKRKQLQELKVIELQNDNEKKKLIFEKQLSDVKLQALKSQMNSHFIFNVLSSIQYFIVCSDVSNALYYLEQFSKLIRKTLNFSDKKTITLAEEINYLKEYLEIENLRTEHPIKLEEYVQEGINTSEIKIFPLLLQPFVENAIVHAFPNRIEKPKITISIKKIDETIQITINDNGIGYQEKDNKTHHSKGISIIEKQLNLTQKLLQKPIQITSSSSGTKVIITLNEY